MLDRICKKQGFARAWFLQMESDSFLKVVKCFFFCVALTGKIYLNTLSHLPAVLGENDGR